ncbi:MAG: hypothetical protein ACD_31C00097G0002 [uncultured bacterium]|nr:MAG: hypothetical protein ACD_31C00097G0002 [uncultured bacterium]
MAKIGNLIQKYIFSKTNWAMWFLSHAPDSFWDGKGKSKALDTFHTAVKKVHAYKEFLKNSGINSEEIKTFEDFQNKIPIMDKNNYIQNNEILDLCPERNLNKMYTVSTSSGSTGKPTFWFRAASQDFMLPKYWETFLIQNWNIDKHSTLVVVSMDLGNWIAGELVATTLKRLAIEGSYRLTIATPGADIEQILDIFDIADNYDQILLVIYPSLIKALLEGGDIRKIDWSKLNIKFWVGGELLSPYLKNYIEEKLDSKKKQFNRFVLTYGSADAGGIGFSSPMSNKINDLVSNNHGLKEKLFGKIPFIPTLVQVNPLAYFVEEINKNLVITYNGGITLIRYNTHDKGGIIPYAKMIKLVQSYGYDLYSELKKEGYNKDMIWEWPFLYIFGRTGNVVKILGANIYPENIEVALYNDETNEINNFRLKGNTNKDGNTNFSILIELKEGIVLEKQEEMKQKYHNIFLRKLLEVNADFRGAYENDKEIADPLIEIYEFRQGPFQNQLKTKAKQIEN